MTEKQKRVLTDAFIALSAGAAKGKRMIKDGATLAEVRTHVEEVEKFMREVKEAINVAAGATNVIDIASEYPRAKTLSSSRRT